MIVIKLGGSAITYKEEDCGPPYHPDERNSRYRVKENVIRELGKSLRTLKGEDIILVHGGGTHGHRTVTRWRKGVVIGPERMMAHEVGWRMNSLTDTIISVLGKEKVPAISVPTSMISLADRGEVSELRTEPVRRVIERGCIPVLRGDLVPDVSGGWSVLSGDTLIREICEKGDIGKGPVSMVIMVMKEKGFMDPGTGDLITEIDTASFKENCKRWKEGLSVQEGDVSGGIWGKVTICHSLASMGIETFLIGVDDMGNVEKMIRGEGSGTRFIPVSRKVEDQ